MSSDTHLNTAPLSQLRVSIINFYETSSTFDQQLHSVNVSKISQQVFYQSKCAAEGFCSHKFFAGKKGNKKPAHTKKISTALETETFKELVENINLMYYFRLAFILFKPMGKLPKTSEGILLFHVKKYNYQKIQQKQKD